MWNNCNNAHTIRLAWVWNLWAKWQIVIPKEIRDTLWIAPWDSVTLVLRDDKMLWIVPNHSISELLEYIESEKNLTLIK